MKTNIRVGERVLRVIGGGILLVAGVLFALGTDAFGIQALAIASIILGLGFIITGLIGFCPLYYKLGRAPVRRTPESETRV